LSTGTTTPEFTVRLVTFGKHKKLGNAVKKKLFYENLKPVQKSVDISDKKTFHRFRVL